MCPPPKPKVLLYRGALGQGETRPERVLPPRAAQVVPASQSQRCPRQRQQLLLLLSSSSEGLPSAPPSWRSQRRRRLLELLLLTRRGSLVSTEGKRPYRGVDERGWFRTRGSRGRHEHSRGVEASEKQARWQQHRRWHRQPEDTFQQLWSDQETALTARNMPRARRAPCCRSSCRRSQDVEGASSLRQILPA